LAVGFKKGGPRSHPYSSALFCPRRRHHQERQDPYGSDTIDREPCGASSGRCFQFSLPASRRAGLDRIPYSSALLCLRRRIIKKGRIPTAPTPLIENLAVHLLVDVSSSRCRLQEGRAGLGRIPTAPPFYVLVAGIIKKGRSCRD
ncbi:hypothetical protein GW17_00034698, partial [Ensete ventricosum]